MRMAIERNVRKRVADYVYSWKRNKRIVLNVSTYLEHNLNRVKMLITDKQLK